MRVDGDNDDDFSRCECMKNSYNKIERNNEF